MLRSYRELRVWQKSFALCKEVYRLSRMFPADERFGLVAQVRRAAVSIPSNIAEGHSRDTTRDYLRYLWVAKGSLAEVETQLLLAKELKFTKEQEIDELLNTANEVGRMLSGLIKSLDISNKRQPVPTACETSSSLNPKSSILDPNHS